MGVVHFSLMFSGLAAGQGVSAVALASQLHVPFATLLAWLLLKEQQPWRRLFGTFVAFTGVLLIGFDPIAFRHLDALLYIAAAAFIFALCTLLMKGLPKTGICTLQAWIAAVAWPSLILLSLIVEQDQYSLLAAASWTELAAPVYSALGASLVGHGIVYYLVQRYPIGVTAPTLLLAPVIAVGIGIVLFNDELSLELTLGGVMTLAGVAIISMQGVDRSHQPLPASIPDTVPASCAQPACNQAKLDPDAGQSPAIADTQESPAK